MGKVVHDPRLAAPRRRQEHVRYVASNLAPAVDREEGPPPPPPPPLAVPAPGRTRAQTAVLALAAIALFAGWIWHAGSEQRALRALPADRRAALYAETLHSYQDTCAAPGTLLVGHCRKQAAFLLEFDECDERCRALVMPMVRWRS